MTIKYKYAKDLFNKIWDIDEISPLFDKKNQLFCIACGDLMIPKLGKGKRIKHFSHKTNLECSKESYLHLLAKHMFKEEFIKCQKENLTFNIEIEQKLECNECHTRKCIENARKFKYNLLNHYDQIEIEVNDGEFKPDLLLTNSKNSKSKLYIEFKVSHASEDKKINSKIKIIEISLLDEWDLNFIKRHNITCENSAIKFYNFNKNHVVKECFNEAKRLTFIHYPSNKSFIGEISGKEIFDIKQSIPNAHIIEYEEKYTKYKKSTMFLISYKKLYDNAKIRRCGACEYLSVNSNNPLIKQKRIMFCLKTGKEIKLFNEGDNCSTFSSYKHILSNNHYIVN